MADELLKSYQSKVTEGSGTLEDVDKLITFKKELHAKLSDSLCVGVKTPAFLDAPKYRKETVRLVLEHSGLFYGVVMCAFEKDDKNVVKEGKESLQHMNHAEYMEVAKKLGGRLPIAFEVDSFLKGKPHKFGEHHDSWMPCITEEGEKDWIQTGDPNRYCQSHLVEHHHYPGWGDDDHPHRHRGWMCIIVWLGEESQTKNTLFKEVSQKLNAAAALALSRGAYDLTRKLTKGECSASGFIRDFTALKVKGEAAIEGFKFSAYFKKKYDLVTGSIKGKKLGLPPRPRPPPPEFQKMIDKCKVRPCSEIWHLEQVTGLRATFVSCVYF